MELRASAKIAIGIVAALGTIGALHLMIFKKNAEQYTSAKRDYDTAAGQYRAQGNARSWNDIYSFKYKTVRYQYEFWDSLSQLNVGFTDTFNPKVPEMATRDAQEEIFWEAYRRLQQMNVEGQNGQGPQLSFLAADGWDFVDTVPQAIIAAGTAIDDKIAALRAANDVLKSLDKTKELFKDREERYRRMLLELGLDLNKRESIRARWGEVAATLHSLNRIDVTMQALSREYFRDTNRRGQLAVMYELFRMHWPEDSNGFPILFDASQQVRGLERILTDAKSQSIEVVGRVIMHPKRTLHWSEGAVAPGAEPTREDDFGGDMDDRRPQRPGRGGGDEKKKGEIVGGGMPIEVVFKANNPNTMSYLYGLANGPMPLELDNLRILQSSSEEGKVFGFAYFNLVTYVHMKDPNRKFGGDYVQLTDLLVREQKAATWKELIELATKPGAGELALEDGLVRMEGNRPVLVVGETPPARGLRPAPAPAATSGT